MAFGRLERTAEAQPMSDINMTPLVDVMLVLVVILIVTAPLMASALRLDLPKSDAARAGDTATAVLLSLDRTGQAYIDDKPIAMVELGQRLKDTAARNPDTEVHLRADGAVPYSRVIELMGAAQKAGLNRIAFAAEARP